MFRDVPGCSGMFHVPGFIDAQFYICKFEVNRDRRTRCTNSWSTLTWKCNANIFVEVDAQMEENCRRTISYLKGYSFPKLQLQEATANSICNTRRTILCRMRGKIKHD